jgi:hypothetical protein
MHALSVPVFVRTLTNMLGWLDKAEAHAAARKFDANNYLGLRLAPDMHPFSRQIQIASDTVKGCVSQLAGVETPKWPDTEATLAELRGRIQKTIDYAQSIPAAQLEGSETREVTPFPGAPRFSGETYLRGFALPNFFFHATMTYALLRHAGVELGKMDFIGRP